MRISVKKTLLSMAAMALVLGAGTAEAETSGKKIALSNNYAVNSSTVGRNLWAENRINWWIDTTKSL